MENSKRFTGEQLPAVSQELTREYMRRLGGLATQPIGADQPSLEPPEQTGQGDSDRHVQTIIIE